MAYAALLSLTQTLEQILAFGDEIRIFYDEKQIKSLHEKLSFLLSFLDDSSPRNTESMTCLEARIRDATYKAEDIIELHMLIEILSEMQHMKRGVIGCFGKIVVMPVFHNSEIYEGLRKVIKKIDSILVDVEKMMGMKNIEGSSNIDSSNKSTVVGFDNDSMQIKDPLSGPPPKFKSTSVVGIEDTEEVVKTIEQNGVQDLQLRNSLRVASSKSVSTKKITMVGFEDDLIQIKEELVGQSSRLKSFQSSEWEELATQHLQEIFTMIHLSSITSTFEPGQLYLRNIKCKNCL